MIEQTLHYHQCISLIDITKTNVLQYSDSKAKERNQQRNFETVCQLVGLRTQLFDIGRVYKIQDTEIDSFKFGSYYLGEMGFKYNVWTFSFAIEFQDVYRLDNDPYGTIKKDFVNVPAILNLDEQMPTIPHSLFYTSGTYKNIYFMKSMQ
jgi:hypothetical protein